MTKRKPLYEDLDTLMQEPQEPKLDPEFLDVYACHEHFGMMRHTIPGRLPEARWAERVAFLKEEVHELEVAFASQDLVKIFDALLDLVYVAKGTAVMMGLPWAEGWDAVHRANMAKVRGIGPRKHRIDLIKPPGWVGPEAELEALLTSFEAPGVHEENDDG